MLEEKLKAEASGILNWLLEGTARWQNEGLVAPHIMMNTVGRWTLSETLSRSGVSLRLALLFGLGNCINPIPTGVMITTNTPLARGFSPCAYT